LIDDLVPQFVHVQLSLFKLIDGIGILNSKIVLQTRLR